jgi:hypothetical protein
MNITIHYQVDQDATLYTNNGNFVHLSHGNNQVAVNHVPNARPGSNNLGQESWGVIHIDTDDYSGLDEQGRTTGYYKLAGGNNWFEEGGEYDLIFNYTPGRNFIQFNKHNNAQYSITYDPH